MIRWLACVLAFAAAGCDAALSGEDSPVPRGLEGLRRDASACLTDVEDVPLQHSEHCVMVSEKLYGAYREDCISKASAECEAYHHEWNKIALIYNGAIIDSLMLYGQKAEITAGIEQFGPPHAVFHEAKLLRKLFGQCLADEARELEVQGFVKVTTLHYEPIAPGQRCIRYGYPRFRTKEAPLS